MKQKQEYGNKDNLGLQTKVPLNCDETTIMAVLSKM
jgi:hypothetical protein